MRSCSEEERVVWVSSQFLCLAFLFSMVTSPLGTDFGSSGAGNSGVGARKGLS